MTPNMTNTLLYFVSIIFYMGLTVLAYRKFGKTGLYVWSAMSVIVANLEAMKMVTMFGLDATLGNAVYASSFLVTDILSEKYGRKSATKAVNIGLFATVIWVIITQQIMWFIPNASDYITPAFKQIFALSPAFALTGIFTYAVTQRADVYLYEAWWNFTNKLWGDKHKGLWIRNNGSTLISQLIDTVVFTGIITLLGIFPKEIFFEMVTISYVLKASANIIDTPFCYLARKITPKGEEE